ncbi:MAG: hypothetical protein ACI8R8_003044 [Paraglaciecola sp.]|jgi:hypothetical protein
MRNSIFRHKTSGQYCSENGLHKFLGLYFLFQLTDFSVVFVPAVVRRYVCRHSTNIKGAITPPCILFIKSVQVYLKQNIHDIGQIGFPIDDFIRR